MSDDVAIVGIGMHEFGRTEGVEGIDQGVVAVRRALRDAGVEWDQIEFAFADSPVLINDVETRGAIPGGGAFLAPAT